ncbi:MAG: class I SAM-dependent methyltransferase [Candidatus Kapaibacterium sp.]
MDQGKRRNVRPLDINKIHRALISPDDGTELKMSGGKLVSGEGREYQIRASVPLLLPAEAISNELHSDYIEHYEIDARTSDYFAEHYCGATEYDFRRLREYIISETGNIAGKLILDAGSGGAWVARELCPKGAEVVSFDISPTNCVKALEHYPYEDHYAVAGDALKPPFRESSFDIVISSEVIEHVVDPVLFSQSLFRLVKPGGILIITTPYREQIHWEVCIHCNKPTPRNAHLHSFDEDVLKSLIKEGAPAGINIKIFGNKALVKLRTHPLTKRLPFGLWKAIDALSNKILNMPGHILARYEK